MKIGVFDSGIGGEAVAKSLQTHFPDAEVLTVNDKINVPYGSKPPEHIISLTDAAIQPLLKANVDIIVLACNTATAAAISWLRKTYPNQQFVGLEPMIKPAAALSKSGVIGICATPSTLSSERYQSLIHRYAGDIFVLEPDCSDWAYMIEHNQINHEHIKTTIESLCSRGADVIVLGCTHYHWIKDLIVEIADGRATIIEPSTAIARRIESLLVPAR